MARAAGVDSLINVNNGRAYAKLLNGQRKTKTEDCRLRAMVRGQNAGCRPRIKCRLIEC